VKNVTNTFCTFLFTGFCTFGQGYLSGIGEHGRKPQEKTRRGKNTKSGGSDPTFSAASRPKSFWGRSRTAALVSVPGVFSAAPKDLRNKSGKENNHATH
jgi:hypothetical protein